MRNEALIRTRAIGRNLMELRKKSSLTLKQLAQRIGLSISLISRIENGQLTPSINTVAKIADGLGVDITHILQNESVPDTLILSTATKLKHRMALLGLSPEELSKQAGIPLMMLKRMLNCEIMLSLHYIIKLAELLKVDVSYFFENAHHREFVLSRRESRSSLEYLGKKGTPLYLVEILFKNFPNQLMEPVISTHVGNEKTMTKVTHPGQEFFYVLEGKLKLYIDDQEIILNPGDGIYFDSMLPHAGISIDGTVAKTLHTHFSPFTRVKRDLLE